MTATCESGEMLPLVSLLAEAALFLWKDWPRDMKARLIDASSSRFSLQGVCPHGDCARPSTFMPVTSIYVFANYWISGMQCQGCMRFILSCTELVTRNNFKSLEYRFHYPVGMPDDSVAEEIPKHIGEDLSEAIRCLSVNAYSATAEMCRRALEASCLDLGAHKKKVLQKMIDELEDKRIITPALKNAAHKVRLGGDRGAHPPENGPTLQLAAVVAEEDEEDQEEGPIEKIQKEHAEAIVDFTRHFFQHVYVIPKQLEKYDFSKPKEPKP